MKKKKANKEGKDKKEISKKMAFAEVMRKHPETADVFFKHGMSCFGCPMAMQETIEQGASAHGIDAEKLVDELNKKVKKKK